MLPIIAMIYAFCLGTFFFARSQYLAGLLAFLTVSIVGVIAGCYLEALAKELLKEFIARIRTVLLFRTHKPQPAPSSNPS